MKMTKAPPKKTKEEEEKEEIQVNKVKIKGNVM